LHFPEVPIAKLQFFNRDPKDNTSLKDKLDYYIWLTELAEKGKIEARSIQYFSPILMLVYVTTCEACLILTGNSERQIQWQLGCNI
jgi:hypothetical protein